MNRPRAGTHPRWKAAESWLSAWSIMTICARSEHLHGSRLGSETHFDLVTRDAALFEDICEQDLLPGLQSAGRMLTVKTTSRRNDDVNAGFKLFEELCVGNGNSP